MNPPKWFYLEKWRFSMYFLTHRHHCIFAIFVLKSRLKSRIWFVNFCFCWMTPTAGFIFTIHSAGKMLSPLPFILTPSSMLSSKKLLVKHMSAEFFPYKKLNAFMLVHTGSLMLKQSTLQNKCSHLKSSAFRENKLYIHLTTH